MKYLRPEHRLLDLGTGGGEALLTFGHPFGKTFVTESYPPNIALCEQKLAPLGITVKGVSDDSRLPFEDTSFDVITCRHESFVVSEIRRLLVPGGYFITQQVGGRNNEDPSRAVIRDYQPLYPDHTLAANVESLEREGMEILFSEETFPKIRFYDIGAFAYFAKIIEWEFPGFSIIFLGIPWSGLSRTEFSRAGRRMRKRRGVRRIRTSGRYAFGRRGD